MTFKITEEIKETYKNIPEDYLKSLEGLEIEKVNEILKTLSENPFEDEFKFNSKDGHKEKEIEDLFNYHSLDEIINILEKEKGIKINVSEKKDTSESGNKGYISIYSKDEQLIGEIWTALYYLGNGNYIDSHLGIEVNPEFQGQNYGNILYKLYLKAVEEENFFLPVEEFATTNSRILLLLKMGYSLESKYTLGKFIDLSEEEKNQIIRNAKENYYDKQTYDYKFLYNG